MNRKVVNNIVWLVMCKAAQSILQLLIGMFTARYLGPSDYGLINYAASIVSFAMPVMKLGFDATLVYELTKNPEREGEIMGTSLALNVVTSLVCMLGVFGFAAVANPGDWEVVAVCVMYSLSLFCAALEMVQYWFQYKLQAKYSATVMLIAYVVISIYKIYLLVSQKSVLWFACIHALEYGIIAVMLFVCYACLGGEKLRFSLKLAKELFFRGKHFIFASLMVMVFQNTDHIMLTEMVGVSENGLYTAAITSAGVLQFVYTALIDSCRPLILAEKGCKEKYDKGMIRLYSVVIYLSLIQSLFFTLFAKLIISILYGADYAGAVPVLQILTWYCAFSFMGSVRNVWILAEQKQKYLWKINLSGAIFNAILNAVMIPIWGACGAAFASLLTQIFTNFVLGYIFTALRENNRYIIQAFKPRVFLEECGSLLHALKAKL